MSGVSAHTLDYLCVGDYFPERFKKKLVELGDNNPQRRARTLAGREGEARMKLFASSCSLGEYRIADVDSVLLDVAEKNLR